MDRTRYWGLSFAPIERMVLVEGQQKPCTFAILTDSQEQFLTEYMMRLPLEVPDVPKPQEGLEAFWEADFQGRLMQLRAQAEARALIALSLIEIDGEPFALSFEDRIAEMRGNPHDPDPGQRGWPTRLIRQLVDIIAQVSRAPIVGVEALDKTPDFAPGLSPVGAFYGGPDTLLN